MNFTSGMSLAAANVSWVSALPKVTMMLKSSSTKRLHVREVVLGGLGHDDLGGASHRLSAGQRAAPACLVERLVLEVADVGDAADLECVARILVAAGREAGSAARRACLRPRMADRRRQPAAPAQWRRRRISSSACVLLPPSVTVWISPRRWRGCARGPRAEPTRDRGIIPGAPERTQGFSAGRLPCIHGRSRWSSGRVSGSSSWTWTASCTAATTRSPAPRTWCATSIGPGCSSGTRRTTRCSRGPSTRSVWRGWASRPSRTRS